MKTVIIWWLAWQLCILGATVVDIHNKVYIYKDRSICKQEKVPLIAGAILPLMAIYPDPSYVEDFCHGSSH